LQNYHLKSTSPAIDRGIDTTGLNLPLTDLDGNPCISGSAIDLGCYEYESVSIYENNDKSYFSIYPNPTNGQLKIEIVETLSATSLQNIQIFDLLGRCLHEVNHIGNTETTIDLSCFDSGMYFVRIQTEAGAVMKKIVKR